MSERSKEDREKDGYFEVDGTVGNLIDVLTRLVETGKIGRNETIFCETACEMGSNPVDAICVHKDDPFYKKAISINHFGAW